MNGRVRAACHPKFMVSIAQMVLSVDCSMDEYSSYVFGRGPEIIFKNGQEPMSPNPKGRWLPLHYGNVIHGQCLTTPAQLGALNVNFHEQRSAAGRVAANPCFVLVAEICMRVFICNLNVIVLLTPSACSTIFAGSINSFVRPGRPQA